MIYVIDAYLCVASFLLGVAATVTVEDNETITAERMLKMIGMALIWPWYFAMFLVTLFVGLVFGERK